MRYVDPYEFEESDGYMPTVYDDEQNPVIGVILGPDESVLKEVRGHNDPFGFARARRDV